MDKQQAETVESYRRLNKLAKRGQILFTGSSLMEQFPIYELAMNHGLNKCIYNRGVGGFTTEDMISNLDVMLLDLEPKTVFINIGTNDLNTSPWKETLEKNYDFILGQMKEKLPGTEVFVMAYYPMDESNEEVKKIENYYAAGRTNAIIQEAGEVARNLAEKYGYHYINVNDGLTDENGNLKKEFCKDNIHFYPDGYELVYRNLEKYLEYLK